MKKGQRVKSIVTGRLGVVLGLNYNGIHKVLILYAERRYEYEYLQHKEMKLA